MQLIYRAIKAILAWLTEPQGAGGGEPAVPCWADLPPYHPADNLQCRT